jgi:hypothetical protein
MSGALGGIRTHGLSLRRAALYPLSYKRLLRLKGLDNHTTVMVMVPKGRFELPRPQGALRPERSASAVPPLRHEELLALRGLNLFV